jgi:hypothetical protein
MSEVEALASPDPATTDWVPMYAVGSGLNYVGLYDPARTYSDGGSGYTGASSPGAAAGGDAAHNNLPPYYAVRWITVAG